MKKNPFHYFSFTGLLLTAASAIMATVMSRNELKKTSGQLLISTNGFGYYNELTCKYDADGNENCTYTATLLGDENNEGVGSRTTTEGDDSSSITDQGYHKVRTITENEDDEVINHAHTSVDES